MAASDYTIRGTGALSQLITLKLPIGRGETVLSFENATGLAENSPLLMGGEVLCVRSVDEDGVHVSRGCADTIPKDHVAGSYAWTLDRGLGFVAQEFLVGETVAAKLLVRAGSQMLSADSVPPNDIRFVGRFIRPYPPGKVLVNGEPWYLPNIMNTAESAMVITWAHRDRVLQADVLQGHEVGNIGPEPGTSYTIDVRNGSGALLRSIEGIEGNTYTYTMSDAFNDFGLEAGEDREVSGMLALRSARDGYDSIESYPITLAVNAVSITLGWGLSWGIGYGG